MITKIKTSSEIEAMRVSGKMLASVLGYLKPRVVPGINTKELADLAKEELRKLGGQPAFLGYYGFPDVLCVSVNDEVVHGIPKTNKIINNGDIVSLDFGVKYQGMITDSAISVIAGRGTTLADRLVITTERSMMSGISVVKDGVNVGDIASAVEAVLNKGKYGIIRELVGHGVGHELHEEPNIPNYGKKGSGMKLLAGMTIAIEPMATLGKYEVITDSDKWTIRTKDGSLAAHFEHTVLITEDGVEILTQI